MPGINELRSGSESFQPHGDSFAWLPDILWLHVAADTIIAFAYLTIPFVFFYIAQRRKDLPFDWPAVCFGVFILGCGLTHAMDVWNLWHTQYWIEGVIKLITAATSIPTAILLWRALPEILSLPSQRQLRDANESLSRANHEMEAFTASVSHDLRAPLTSIAGQAGMLEMSLPGANEDQKRRLSRIQGSVRQMADLIDALLGLSRISRYTLHREIVDLSAVAESALAELRQKDPQREVAVVIQPGIQVHGDRRLIEGLVTNLLANAWKFTGKTEQAQIEFGRADSIGGLVTLFVRDNGAGFDMAYEQKLFKLFQRLHGAGEFEGSGVGLATVARIVDRHGGRIWAESKPQQGATFFFTMPTTPMRGLERGPGG